MDRLVKKREMRENSEPEQLHSEREDDEYLLSEEEEEEEAHSSEEESSNGRSKVKRVKVESGDNDRSSSTTGGSTTVKRQIGREWKGGKGKISWTGENRKGSEPAGDVMEEEEGDVTLPDGWSGQDVTLFRMLHPIFGHNYCAMAEIITSKTCNQVHATYPHIVNTNICCISTDL